MIGLHRWALDELQSIEPDFSAASFAQATGRRLLVGHLAGETCVVVSEDAPAHAWDWLQGRFPESARVGLARDDDVDAMLARAGAGMRAMDDVSVGDGAGRGDSAVESVSLASLAAEPSPVVKALGSTLFDAFRSGASDVHLESNARGAEIKYRLDGVLASISRIDSAEIAEQLISRIKVLARLDVGERRVPQDGRFKLRLEGREVDFRVSVIPSAHGEDAVLRLLDRRHLADDRHGLSLARLGFDAAMRESLIGLASLPHGMLLVTGPTGSGKTTTLYAALSEVITGRQKIVTIEDPVEYQLPGVLQVPVNERTGLTFARGLRAILRHDPDVILVGEIRDQETAQIAVQAALTGHLVLSSIHANTVFDVLARFVHMGVDPFELTSALNAVVAQRLVRINCPRCAEPEPIPQELRSRFAPLAAAGHAMRGRGCGECRGTGYRGRLALGELLRVTDEIREAIVARQPARRMREIASAQGMQRLSEQAAARTADGTTSIEELRRVAQMD